MPRLPVQYAHDTWGATRELQTHAAALDRVHQRSARRQRRLRKARRAVVFLLVLAVALLSVRYLPWVDWWYAAVDATDGPR